MGYELDVALSVMKERNLASCQPVCPTQSFVVVEFSSRAAEVYRERIRTWAQAEAVGAGLSVEDWEQRHQLGPEFAYYMQSISCEKATCSSEKDEKMIRDLIEAKGGKDAWKQLDHRIAEFRRPPARYISGC